MEFILTFGNHELSSSAKDLIFEFDLYNAMDNNVGFAYLLTDDKVTEFMGIKHSDYYRDIRLQVKAKRKALEIIKRELGISLGLGLSLGCGTSAAAVMGCKLTYPENAEPWTKPVLSSIEDELIVPEPQDNPAVQEILFKARIFEELASIKPTVGFDGPVTTAALCRGINDFFVDIYKSPGLCMKLVERITKAAIEWIKYYEEEMDIGPSDHIGLADDHASFLHPKYYDSLGLPYEQKFYNAFPERKYRSLHICGPTDHILTEIKSLGLNSFELGEMVDLRKAKDILDDVHIARLFDFKLLMSGSDNDVIKYTKEQIHMGAPGGKFSIHIEGWRPVTFEKVRLVRDIIKEYNVSEMHNSSNESSGPR